MRPRLTDTQHLASAFDLERRNAATLVPIAFWQLFSGVPGVDGLKEW